MEDLTNMVPDVDEFMPWSKKKGCKLWFKQKMKQDDDFKSNMNFKWPKQNKSTGDIDFVSAQGSWFGGINSFFMQLVFIWLMIFKTLRTFGGIDDMYSGYQVINEYDDAPTSIMNFTKED